MSRDKYTTHFWVSRPVNFFRPTRYPKIVFTEVNQTTLIFDLLLFFSKTREQLENIMDKEKVDSHMGAFTSEIYSGELHSHNVERYKFVSQLMYEKIVKDEIGLNVETVYSYQGNNDVNEVLEDCLTAVSVNSERIWVTGKPIMNDASNLAVTIQEIQPLSWIKRKLHIEPHIVYDTTFESGKATHISGTCKRFIINVAGKKLEVHTNGFNWLS